MARGASLFALVVLLAAAVVSAADLYAGASRAMCWVHGVGAIRCWPAACVVLVWGGGWLTVVIGRGRGQQCWEWIAMPVLPKSSVRTASSV